jgi:hypothetical protein
MYSAGIRHLTLGPTRRCTKLVVDQQMLNGKGEVDPLTGSEALTVDRGGVLQDPKVKGYQHLALAAKWRPTDTRRDRHEVA